MTRIIAICGPKRSGKDTIANYIVAKYGYKHFKIASKLKDVCGLLFGFTQEQMEDDTKDIIDTKYNITPRKAMQFVGTEMMQYKIQELLPNVKRNFWINLLMQEIQKESHVVISDMRFLHEYETMCKESDLHVIQVSKPNSGSDSHLDLHPSEVEWRKIPTTTIIENNKTIEDLYEQVDRACYLRLIKVNNPRS